MNTKDFVYDETVLHKIVRLKMIENFKVKSEIRPTIILHNAKLFKHEESNNINI